MVIEEEPTYELVTHYSIHKMEKDIQYYELWLNLECYCPLLRTAAVTVPGGLFKVLFTLVAISTIVLIMTVTTTTISATKTRLSTGSDILGWSHLVGLIYPITTRYDALPSVAFWWNQA
jgi:hypothetical protein